MIVNEAAVAIDTDFFNHLVETDRDIKEIANAFQLALDELQIWAVIHPLVYSRELEHTLTERKTFLFKKQIIKLASFEDIFQGDEDKKAYYIQLIPDLYYRFTGTQLAPDFDVLASWKASASLGEVHSVAMCLLCNCGIFLSDDEDSKDLANLSYIKNQLAFDLKVLSRKEFFDTHALLGKTALPRSMRKSLSHQ